MFLRKIKQKPKIHYNRQGIFLAHSQPISHSMPPAHSHEWFLNSAVGIIRSTTVCVPKQTRNQKYKKKLKYDSLIVRVGYSIYPCILFNNLKTLEHSGKIKKASNSWIQSQSFVHIFKNLSYCCIIGFPNKNNILT